MQPTTKKLSILRTELDFLERGGYSKPIVARQPLFCMETSAEQKTRTFFEDSPVCPKERHAACNPEGSCVLMDFVPADQRQTALPCHHIPLNEKGDTIASLEMKGDREAVRAAIRSWAAKNIETLEGDSPNAV